MRQRLDIADLAARTKIRAKYLRALENEDFDQLPGPTYARTFLRTYAEFLGLDPHLLVEEYRTRHEPPGEEELHPFAGPTPASTRRRPREPAHYRGPPGRAGGRGTLVAGVIVGAVVLLLVIGLVTGDDEPVEPTRPGARQEERSIPTEPPPDPRTAKQKREPQPTPDELVLLVRPVDETYVCVDDGRGNVEFEGTLTAPRRFRGKVVRLNLGRTSAGLEVNGSPVKLEESSEPVGFEFDADGQEPIPQGERPCQ